MQLVELGHTASGVLSGFLPAEGNAAVKEPLQRRAGQASAFTSLGHLGHGAGSRILCPGGSLTIAGDVGLISPIII